MRWVNDLKIGARLIGSFVLLPCYRLLCWLSVTRGCKISKKIPILFTLRTCSLFRNWAPSTPNFRLHEQGSCVIYW